MKHVTVKNVTFGQDLPFVLIAGPCQIESREHAFEMAHAIKAITDELKIPFVFKSSYDKANRSSLGGKRGIGMEKGLQILKDIGDQLNVPTLTDIHETHHCAPTAAAVDILQIPAFLCRQTDLLLAAGNTGAAIHVKKGQFLAPWDMKNVADKIASTGNEKILLCERGTSFGYNTLVVDYRGIPTMAQTGYPVVMDATHAVMKPGGNGTSSGGDRRFVPVMARAALSLGVAGVFIETHQDPDSAPSDGPNMVPLDKLKALLSDLKSLDDWAKQRPIAL